MVNSGMGEMLKPMKDCFRRCSMFIAQGINMTELMSAMNGKWAATLSSGPSKLVHVCFLVAPVQACSARPINGAATSDHTLVWKAAVHTPVHGHWCAQLRAVQATLQTHVHIL